MKCPREKCNGMGALGNYVTHNDHAHLHFQQHQGRHYPLLGWASVAWVAARQKMAKTYKCKSCEHIWRVW